eukprot:3617385-Alexandrium_andersonii.AAC.1
MRRGCAPHEKAPVEGVPERLLDEPRQTLLCDVERCEWSERRGHRESLHCCTPRAALCLKAAVESRPRSALYDRGRTGKLL